jgi:alpha,alpha-trehalase
MFPRTNSRPSILLWLSLCFALAFTAASAPAQNQRPADLTAIRAYILSGWDKLTRSVSDCASVVDPKINVHPVVYLPAGMTAPPALDKMRETCGIQIEHLPAPIHHLGEIDVASLHSHGLLYLPNKYVVPGGRFNEMYGWDSYFIILGLIRDGRVDLARGMVENFFFEIENYGAVLNANRTYYLTRSQPPFLSSMVFAVYDAEKQAGHDDRAWLEKAYAFIEHDYGLWVSAHHLAGSTGLSRYYDFGQGPPPEALKDESDAYRKVAAYFVSHPDQANHFVEEEQKDSAAPGSGAAYTVTICDSARENKTPDCEMPRYIRLSSDYYKGDRAMRESGFDISFRFGPYGAATHHYAPVCLNSLLYKTETDMEQISHILGKTPDVINWRDRAAVRKKKINEYLWDPARGLFFDYDFTVGKRSEYQYVTTLYPLWAGVATPQQAASVATNLKIFEQPGGLATSTFNSGVQWDYPYGWAPLELLAVEGLRRYGHTADADRISQKFLSTVMENFQRDGTIREKYNVVTRSSESQVQVGYQQNVIGFGWTNGVVLELLHGLPESQRAGAQGQRSRFTVNGESVSSPEHFCLLTSTFCLLTSSRVILTIP